MSADRTSTAQEPAPPARGINGYEAALRIRALLGETVTIAARERLQILPEGS